MSRSQPAPIRLPPDVEPGSTDAALAELFARMGAAGGEVALSDTELRRWPAPAVAMLKARKLLVPSTPAESALCPGCEQACTMPVEWASRGAQRAAFIVCNQREDIHRVKLDAAGLGQWRSGLRLVAEVLRELLATGPSITPLAQGANWRVGEVVTGQNRAKTHLMLHDGELVLEVAGHQVELAALLSAHGDRLVLDLRRLAHCADHPMRGVEGAGTGEPPEQRRDRLLARKALLKAQGVKAFEKQLADEEGISVSMLKKILTRPDNPAKPADPFAGLGLHTGGDLPPKRRQR